MRARIRTLKYPDMVDRMAARQFPAQRQLPDANGAFLLPPRISDASPLLPAHTVVSSRQRLLLDKIPTFDRIQIVEMMALANQSLKLPSGSGGGSGDEGKEAERSSPNKAPEGASVAAPSSSSSSAAGAATAATTGAAGAEDDGTQRDSQEAEAQQQLERDRRAVDFVQKMMLGATFAPPAAPTAQTDEDFDRSGGLQLVPVTQPAPAEQMTQTQDSQQGSPDRTQRQPVSATSSSGSRSGDSGSSAAGAGPTGSKTLSAAELQVLSATGVDNTAWGQHPQGGKMKGSVQVKVVPTADIIARFPKVGRLASKLVWVDIYMVVRETGMLCFYENEAAADAADALYVPYAEGGEAWRMLAKGLPPPPVDVPDPICPLPVALKDVESFLSTRKEDKEGHRIKFVGLKETKDKVRLRCTTRII